jgi:hypothetical protein
VISCRQENIHLVSRRGKRKQTERQFHRNTESELEKCYIKFANTFSYDGSSDVELYDLISKLKIMKCTLPNDTLFAIEIFQHTRDMNCYLSTCLSNLIYYAVKSHDQPDGTVCFFMTWYAPWCIASYSIVIIAYFIFN